MTKLMFVRETLTVYVPATDSATESCIPVLLFCNAYVKLLKAVYAKLR